MKEAFIEWTPKGANLVLLLNSITVVETYTAQGYRLTLRQLYYQLVSRDIIPNNEKSYKNLGELISKARLAGYIDWDDIVDRGRSPVVPPQWDSPAAILEVAASQYRLDRWEGQPHYVEVWCEKDALSSVLEPVGSRYHVRYMANRGYSSSTAMYDAAQRLVAAEDDGKSPVVIYLGDHDPSGLDMVRDVEDRLRLMGYGAPIHVVHLALTHAQVLQYNPPPNPAKVTDSRAGAYISEYGPVSWELDALEPQVLDQLVSDTIEGLLDRDLYDEALAREEADKERIKELAQLL